MSKNKQEYLREYRKKNLNKLREQEKRRKRKARLGNKIDKSGHGITDAIIRDLAVHIPQGLPDIRNHSHISILGEVLKQHGWNDEAVKVYINELLLPVRVGQKKYEQILEERRSKDKQYEIWKLIGEVLENNGLSDILDEKIEDVDYDDWHEAFSLWVDGKESNFKWKYCPHCGEEINSE
tara:strand:+ start:617 stop:1156 length:540 start_codon:yes stop_codon:yes gene_type:complete